MRESSTRREFLLATGTVAALAGCSERLPLSDDAPEQIPLHQLPDVPDEGASRPIVSRDIPVDIERERLVQAATRVTDLLETLPIPFGPADVPNGYVRHELIEAAETATEHLDEARSANTRLAALQSLHHARTEARYAAEGWAFVERGRTKADLQVKHRETVAEAEAFQSRYEYLGDDPVRAVVVHAHLRQDLQRVLDTSDPFTYRDPSALLTVGEWGERAEAARTYLADSRYLYDQFASSLPSTVGTVESILDAAAESLTADLRRRRDELPPEPTEMDDELAGRIRSRLRHNADSTARNLPAGGPARTILFAVEGLAQFLAHDRIQSRIEDGERFRAETGADVRKARSEALEAVREALEESPRPELTRGVLADVARLVMYADDELARYRTSVRPGRLNHPVRRYVTATAQARSVPTARQTVIEALEP